MWKGEVVSAEWRFSDERRDCLTAVRGIPCYVVINGSWNFYWYRVRDYEQVDGHGRRRLQADPGTLSAAVRDSAVHSPRDSHLDFGRIC